MSVVAAPAEVASLEALYAALPVLECLGLCGHSCAQHVDASAAERTRITQQGVDLDAPTQSGACPALTRTAWGADRCSVHAVRPMICRLWGTAAAMPCPHGCRPEGGLVDDRVAMRWMVSSLQIGGHRHADIEDLMNRCLEDSVAASLLARFLRGDRSVAVDLRARLRVLAAATGQAAVT